MTRTRRRAAEAADHERGRRAGRGRHHPGDCLACARAGPVPAARAAGARAPPNTRTQGLQAILDAAYTDVLPLPVRSSRESAFASVAAPVRFGLLRDAPDSCNCY